MGCIFKGKEAKGVESVKGIILHVNSEWNASSPIAGFS